MQISARDYLETELLSEITCVCFTFGADVRYAPNAKVVIEGEGGTWQAAAFMKNVAGVGSAVVLQGGEMSSTCMRKAGGVPCPLASGSGCLSVLFSNKKGFGGAVKAQRGPRRCSSCSRPRAGASGGDGQEAAKGGERNL